MENIPTLPDNSKPQLGHCLPVVWLQANKPPCVWILLPQFGQIARGLMKPMTSPCLQPLVLSSCLRGEIMAPLIDRKGRHWRLLAAGIVIPVLPAKHVRR